MLLISSEYAAREVVSKTECVVCTFFTCTLSSCHFISLDPLTRSHLPEAIRSRLGISVRLSTLAHRNRNCQFLSSTVHLTYLCRGLAGAWLGNPG